LDEGFPRGARNYWRSAFFKELSEDVVGVLVDAFERTPSPMSGMVIEHFHGAVTRIDPTATAFPHREPGYNLVLTGEWLDPTEDEPNIAWVRHTFEALTPFMADAVYVNYLSADEPERVRAAYGPNWERLVALKRKCDPDNVFHLNQNIHSIA
jgi:FAD/FMN-containing dehydrogenase